MKAIILAAGMSTRLRSLCREFPKTLLPLGKTTIIENQIQLLRGADVDDIVVVTGFCAEKVEKVLGASVRYIFNPFYAIANSIASLWLARDEIRGDTLYVHGDLVYTPALLRNLLASRSDICLMVDPEPESEEIAKVRIEAGRITYAGKDVSVADCQGESLGMVKCNPAGAERLRTALELCVRAGVVDADHTAVIRLLIAEGHDVTPVFTGGEPWIEVDFPEDYEKAKELFAKF